MAMAFEDSESTKSLFFAEHHRQMIDISDHGLIRVWRFPEAELMWSHHFENEVVEMVYSSLHDLILIGFRGQLRFLCWGEEPRMLEELEERAMQFNFLTHLVLSHNERMVALGIESNSDRSHLIEVYELGLKEFRMKLKMRFDSAIDYVDFSRSAGEKSFILIKTQTRLELYDLNSLTEVSHQTAFKLDWLGLGLQVAEKTRRARELHS